MKKLLILGARALAVVVLIWFAIESAMSPENLDTVKRWLLAVHSLFVGIDYIVMKWRQVYGDEE